MLTNLINCWSSVVASVVLPQFVQSPLSIFVLFSLTFSLNFSQFFSLKIIFERKRSRKWAQRVCLRGAFPHDFCTVSPPFPKQFPHFSVQEDFLGRVEIVKSTKMPFFHIRTF